MAAYYNEIDPFAAQWLRNLIAAGHIAPGEVDERDIRDVSPTDLVRFDQCHFFAGIGGWSRALRLAGIPDDAPVWTGSCPCQPFSAAGSGGGFADERHVWPAWFHLVDVCRPAKIYGEQVASPDALEWFDLVCADLENAGYAVGGADLCAAGLGAPHIRQRLWFVADADGIGRAAGREGRAADGYRNPTESSGGALVMADATRRGFGTNGSAPGNAGHIDERGAFGVMGHALESGLERLARDGDGTPRREIAARSIAETSDACGMGADARDERAGALAGFWRSADWLFCRDGKWRPVEPIVKPLVDGLPESLGRLRAGCALEIEKEIARYAETSDRTASEIVRDLWRHLIAETVFGGQAGEFGPFQTPQILLAFLCELASEGRGIAEGISRASTKAARDELRKLRDNEGALRPPHQRGLAGQQPEQSADAMSFLSRVLARYVEAEWGEAYWANARATSPLATNAKARVGRLRAYGNAIVPQVAAEFVRATL